ncbi:type II toxin-antitoxin system HicA family toxin [Methylobacillus flagellatus]|uniref:type II toxin-antitoxin system HicA family toxin n=1 Tax=Methylobacillus flagellatus TaxID=405 RepID=UPI002853EC59|nr:type II toxin-antitoxin system HicA family toxin [Methylobacillus flagellatus]MDR5170708.1 type II toxin-antitoxin system HicA family toxin [Methylobacillus flagellatus]
MSKKDKRLQAFYATPIPTDYSWDDFVSLMDQLDFKGECQGGSHYMFEHTGGTKFSISKTHPNNILKIYQIKNAKKAIEEAGALK